MAAKKVDLQTRLRIAAHLRKARFDRQFETDAAMARYLGVHRGTLDNVLTGAKNVGLDVLLKIHRKLHISIDALVGTDPPKEWFDPKHRGPPPTAG